MQVRNPPPPKKNIVFLSMRFESVLANCAHPDEMPHHALMRHFIWVFTFCQSNRLGGSSPQQINES